MRLQRAFERISNLGRPAKTVLVVAGYVAAFMLASLAYDIRVAHEDPADVQASGGMYAFGDGMYFLLVFSICASLPTGAALWFLRRAQRLWSLLTAGALLLASSSVLALVLYFASVWSRASINSTLSLWGAASVLLLLFAPMLAGASLVCLLFAPDRQTRTRFFIAMAAEGICGAAFVVHLAVPFANGPAGP